MHKSPTGGCTSLVYLIIDVLSRACFLRSEIDFACARLHFISSTHPSPGSCHSRKVHDRADPLALADVYIDLFLDDGGPCMVSGSLLLLGSPIGSPIMVNLLSSLAKIRARILHTVMRNESTSVCGYTFRQSH
jgi:hypothetical protein